MLVDSVSNAAFYAAAAPALKEALSFLARPDIAKLTPGRYEVDARGAYALVQSNELRPRGEGRFESHEKYIDLQCVLSGTERIVCARRDALLPDTPYDGERDVAFWQDGGAMSVSFALTAGEFALLMPWDAHMPGLRPDDAHSARATKVVVKIPLF